MKKLILLLTQLFCHHKYQYIEINHDGLNTMECKWCGKKKVVKVLSLLALALVMCRCDLENMPAVSVVGDYEIVVIDTCQYIRTSGYDVHYEHKGNCKFCAERRKKEQEELIRKIQNNE